MEGIHFCSQKQKGAMFHFLSPVQEIGKVQLSIPLFETYSDHLVSKVGAICIGNTREEADETFSKVWQFLDKLALEQAILPNNGTSLPQIM